MPKKFLPSQAELASFFTDITERLGCSRVSVREVVDWVDSIPKDEPLSRYKQSQTGLELCYRYTTTKSPVEVVIWTTYVEGNQQARESDAGWVLILEKSTRTPVFFSFPIHRTKNFLKTMTRYIEVFIEMVNHWPVCSVCTRALTIKQVPGVLLGKTFVCPEGHRVRGWIYQGLSDRSTKFLEARYKAYAQYRNKLADAGKTTTPRVFIRSGVASPVRKKDDNGFTSQASPDTDNVSQVNPLADKYPFSDTQHEE